MSFIILVMAFLSRQRRGAGLLSILAYPFRPATQPWTTWLKLQAVVNLLKAEGFVYTVFDNGIGLAGLKDGGGGGKVTGKVVGAFHFFGRTISWTAILRI